MTESPDWSLLPHDPTSFFQLEEGFSRRDLKKRYHALIRQYKPERAPNEFQKIRAAFEMLDGQLRYGRRNEVVAVNTFDWGATVAKAPVTSMEPAAGTPAAAPSLSERLETTPAKQLYAELQSQKPKTPQDYYALAVLSDIVEPQDKQMFLRWLLTGLQQHSHEPGLLALLREILRTEPPAKMAAKTLVAISKVVNNDRFYYITEPIWDRLVSSLPFEQLKKTLSACERNLRDLRVQGKVAFYVHLVRRVMWKAPISWLEDTFRFLNEHHSIIERGLDYDMEFAEAIFRYRQSCEATDSRSSVHNAIHKTICQYCELDELKGDRVVIGCQTRLANDSDGVLDAFPCEAEEVDPLLMAWEFISEDVAARQSEAKAANEQEMAKSAFHCLQDCQRAESGRNWWFVLYGPFLLNLLVATLILATSMLAPDGVPLWPFLVAAGVGAIAFYPVARKLRHWLIITTIRRLYRRVWRERTARFAAATQLPFRHLLALLHQAAEFHEDEFHVGPWIVGLASSDTGLAVYATARQFLR